MKKINRDAVSSEMRERLLANRHGKLTSGQWWDVVTEPLVVLLLLLAPAIIVLRYLLISFFFGGLWMIGTAALLGFVVMLLLRARRYARMPVHFALLQSGNAFRPAWMFWKGWELYDEANKLVRFPRSLSPSMQLQPGRPYMVYYLDDRSSLVLLSIAPADHPDADLWKPSAVYEERLARRQGST
jgi:hypothetical protein